MLLPQLSQSPSSAGKHFPIWGFQACGDCSTGRVAGIGSAAAGGIALDQRHGGPPYTH